MGTPVGSRVGAILSATADEVKFLGYGIYDGDHEPPFGPMQSPKDEHDSLVAEMKADGRLPPDYTWKNPRITLDNGCVVWGCQCWWGPEATIREKIGRRRIVEVALTPNDQDQATAAGGSPGTQS